MGSGTEGTNKPIEPTGYGREKWYHHTNWRRRLVFGVGIIAIVIGVVILMNPPVKETTQILAERIDIGGRFYVSPGKVLVNLGDEPVTIPVVIKNKGVGSDTYTISILEPIGLTDGYKVWDGSYNIVFGESVRIRADRLAEVEVTLTKNESGGRQEIWLVIAESDLDLLIQELAVRILVNG